MDGAMDDSTSPFSESNGGQFSPHSQHLLNNHHGPTSAFSTTSSRASPFEVTSPGGSQRQQPISSHHMRSQGQTPPLSPIDAAFQYYGSNSGFSTGNINNSMNHGVQIGGSYLSSNSQHIGQDVYGSATTGGQYDSGWNNSISRSSSLSTTGGIMDHQQPGSRGSGGGYSPNIHMQQHQLDWQGSGAGMRGMISQDPHGDVPFMQNNYNMVSDFNGPHNPQNNMLLIGMQQQMNRSNSQNRFASSQMSQMGGGHSGMKSSMMSPTGTGGSNAQGRALNKMLLEILRDRMVDPNRLAMAIDANIERMDCVNLATLLFHTGKKRLLLTPSFIKRIAARFNLLKEELRAREASNALYGLKCMSSECVEVRQLIFALATKVAGSNTELVAQAVGNALYGCQMMTSDHEEVRYLLQVLSVKINQCTELLEAQNVGNALYGLRGMGSDYKEVRALLSALTPKVATAREDLNGQALGNSLYGLQGMSSREQEVRTLLTVLAQKVVHTREALKAQEVGNALYGLKRMSSDVLEVRQLIDALVPKVASSPEILDAQAIGNSFYGMQNMHADNPAVLNLLATMADKVSISGAELDGQAMGNSLYGLQGMSSEHAEVRAVVNAITTKIQSSCLEMNAQELGNALYGLQDMTSDYPEVRRLMTALSQKVASSKHELTSQEIGNALFGLQGMRANVWETRVLVLQMAVKIQLSHSLIDPQGISNSLYGIQRMTSDCEDVRMLVQALAAKIELSWKLLSSQHLANCMFGLQGLSSAESEVRALVHALVPKILACRDELSAEQICHALYGLQNLSSEHEEVLPLVGALTEKLTLCTETITIRDLASAMYGLQGMDVSSTEIKLLIAAMGIKLAAADEIDATSLGNCMYSMQRIDNSSAEVCTLLSITDSLLCAIVDSGLELSPQVCANILYGLQNCSIADESTRRIMYLMLNRIKDILAAQAAAPTVKAGPLGRFSDLLGLYQALSLVAPMQPDLEIDPELQVQMLTVQAAFAQIVAERSSEFKPVPLSATEARLVDGITELLAKEPFEVTHSELVHGFTACVVVRLKGNLHLQTSSGVLWNPMLIIEPAGGANERFPRRQLFTRLKHDFFGHSHGIPLQTVPVAALMGEGRNLLRERLLEVPNLLHALYPPTQEDSANFSPILFGMGLVGSDGIMSSLNSSSDPRTRNSSPHASKRGGSSDQSGGNSISFFSGGSNSAYSGSGVNEPCDGSLECCLDFHETAPYTAAQRNVLANSMVQQGMAIRWIGDSPTAVATSPSPHPRAAPLNRTPAVLPSAAGISIMPATNSNSSSKYTPTLTSPSGASLSANGPFPPPSLSRNISLRSVHSQPQGLKVTTTMGYSNSQSSCSVSPHMSTCISRNGSVESASLDKRALTERLQAVASYPTIDIGQRMGYISRCHSRGESQSRSPKRYDECEGVEDSERDQAAVEKQIEELEAELEIARLEAKLMKLRNTKAKQSKAYAPPAPAPAPVTVTSASGQDSSIGNSRGPEEMGSENMTTTAESLDATQR